MSYNTILLQLDIDRPVRSRVAYAKAAALMFDADLIGFCAAEPRYVMPTGDSDLAIAEAMQRQVDEIEDRLAKVRQEFFQLAGDDKRVSWRGEIGNPNQLLALHSRAADLIVAGSGPLSAVDSNRTVDHGTLLLSAGRPVLLAPADFKPVSAEAVLIAWKDTREARRAVADAMPFLTAASRVRVVALGSVDGTARQGIDDVVSFLARHGVRATAEAIDVGGADEAEALLQIADEYGADLLVSGAYGHSRIREWAFGGVTRALLRSPAINRLMSN
ncbi:universal stress protein [Aminobacter sp. SR38]|jgi:nucleotide-binding universal stress UspA family protein|uniref:universal stress protein n=1 Tax=Aminobacter sp. SR38 TaxID=2774562 RepID=UPI00177AB79D|nr:universal stress protein [Aminobacter sp. SR38]QOF71312.1 universal stress protein [Aminobacter sp. SR38]